MDGAHTNKATDGLLAPSVEVNWFVQSSWQVVLGGQQVQRSLRRTEDGVGMKQTHEASRGINNKRSDPLGGGFITSCKGRQKMRNNNNPSSNLRICMYVHKKLHIQTRYELSTSNPLAKDEGFLHKSICTKYMDVYVSNPFFVLRTVLYKYYIFTFVCTYVQRTSHHLLHKYSIKKSSIQR